MGPFVKGDVVVVPFPFSDLTRAKRRLALVIAVRSTPSWPALGHTLEGGLSVNLQNLSMLLTKFVKYQRRMGINQVGSHQQSGSFPWITHCNYKIFT